MRLAGPEMNNFTNPVLAKWSFEEPGRVLFHASFHVMTFWFALRFRVKKNSVSDRQKPSAVNGYAYRFALQKEKKAKESQNRKVSSGAAEPRQPQHQHQQISVPVSGSPAYQEMTSYPAQNSFPAGDPQFNSAPLQQQMVSHPGNGPGKCPTRGQYA